MVDSKEPGHSVARPIPSLLSAMLRASEGILELLPIATFICDSKGTILQYNAMRWRSGARLRAQARRTINSGKASVSLKWTEHQSRARWLPKSSQPASPCVT